MIDIFLCIFIMSFFSLGLYFISQPNMILYFFYKFITNIKFFSYFKKPLITCPTCMSSIWGTIIYWILIKIFFTINIKYLIIWPICLICCASINTILFKIYSFFDIYQISSPNQENTLDDWDSLKS